MLRLKMSTNLLLINNESKNSLIETAEKADMSTKKITKPEFPSFFACPGFPYKKASCQEAFLFIYSSSYSWVPSKASRISNAFSVGFV